MIHVFLYVIGHFENTVALILTILYKYMLIIFLVVYKIIQNKLLEQVLHLINKHCNIMNFLRKKLHFMKKIIN